jgi:hypothetical protein
VPALGQWRTRRAIAEQKVALWYMARCEMSVMFRVTTFVPPVVPRGLAQVIALGGSTHGHGARAKRTIREPTCFALPVKGRAAKRTGGEVAHS